MQKEHTPARTTPGRTMFRFNQAEHTEALTEWLAKHGDVIPDGKVHVEPWAAVLIVVDHAPPPTRKDVKDE